MNWRSTREAGGWEPSQGLLLWLVSKTQGHEYGQRCQGTISIGGRRGKISR